MWILAAALILAPSAAQAQVWWDFIESLSGPGPFKGGGVYWRLGCFKETIAPATATTTAKTKPTPTPDSPEEKTTTANTTLAPTSTTSQWHGKCYDDTGTDIRQIVEVRYLQAWTVDKRPVLIVDSVDKREVTLYKADAIAAVRLTPHLDVGAGGGLMHFTFDALNPPKERRSVTRATIIPISVTYTPLAPFKPPVNVTEHRRREQWKRALRIRMEVTYIPFGFTAKDWDKDTTTIPESVYSTDGNWVLTGGLLIDLRGLPALWGK
jgi:hypothetical protein